MLTIPSDPYFLPVVQCDHTAPNYRTLRSHQLLSYSFPSRLPRSYSTIHTPFQTFPYHHHIQYPPFPRPSFATIFLQLLFSTTCFRAIPCYVLTSPPHLISYHTLYNIPSTPQRNHPIVAHNPHPVMSETLWHNNVCSLTETHSACTSAPLLQHWSFHSFFKTSHFTPFKISRYHTSFNTVNRVAQHLFYNIVHFCADNDSHFNSYIFVRKPIPVAPSRCIVPYRALPHVWHWTQKLQKPILPSFVLSTATTIVLRR